VGTLPVWVGDGTSFFQRWSLKGIGIFERIFILLLIISVAWLIVKLTYVFEDIIVNQFKIDREDMLKSKKIRTQIQVLRKVVIAIVVIIALGVILMSFDKVRYGRDDDKIIINDEECSMVALTFVSTGTLQ